jgi:hypothetical protein
MTKNPRRAGGVASPDGAEVARRYTVEAIETILDVMRNPEASDAVRVQAANSMLDRGWGRPPVEVETSGRAAAPDVVYHDEAEFRRALIERGIPEKLMPPSLEPEALSDGDERK